jgi:hypothetical protein
MLIVIKIISTIIIFNLLEFIYVGNIALFIIVLKI